MDPNTALGLGVFALAAILLGWIVRTFVRALVRGVGTLKDVAAQQVAALQADQQAGLAPARRPAAPGSRAATAAPPTQRPRQAQRAAPALSAATLHPHPHHAGYLLGPFHRADGMLRSIVVAEALGPPLALRRPEAR